MTTKRFERYTLRNNGPVSDCLSCGATMLRGRESSHACSVDYRARSSQRDVTPPPTSEDIDIATASKDQLMAILEAILVKRLGLRRRHDIMLDIQDEMDEYFSDYD